MSTQERSSVLLVTRSFIIDKGKVLILLRSPNASHNPNLWEVPGGKLEQGQRVHEALEREVIEETGLIVEPIDTMAHVESRIINDGPYQGMTYVVLFGLSIVVGGKIYLNKKEHVDHRWCTLFELFSLSLTPETKLALKVSVNTLQKAGVI
jgi:8-oxo-dGTP pyrophosphatase MutT (NUDIX family)